MEPPEPKPTVSLCVLSSSSGGNCSVLCIEEGGVRRAVLIDCGLSPRRTRLLMREVGLTGVPIAAIILTHLDHDHFNSSWLSKWPPDCRLHIHRRHRSRADRHGLTLVPTDIFQDAFDAGGLGFEPLLMSHDDLGSAAFRVSISGRSLGYATDLGRATEALVRHLQGVDVLAIESNYCPRLQRASPRPAFLKRRIMDGSGHLSNEQSARAVAEIGVREHVVLLHLSRECNHPNLAAAPHAQAPYRLTVAHHERPTDWVPVAWPGAPAAPRPRPITSRAANLWDVAAV